MKKIGCFIFFWLSFTSICVTFLLITLFTAYYPAVKEIEQYNNNTCLITAYNDTSYSCDYKFCHDGYIVVNYTVQKFNLTNAILICENCNNDYKSKYFLNQTLPCYYNKVNLNEVILYLSHDINIVFSLVILFSIISSLSFCCIPFITYLNSRIENVDGYFFK